MPPTSDKPSKKSTHKKLTEEEKLEKKKEKQLKLLRDQFERELKFNEISIKRNEQTHFKLAQKFKTDEALIELNASIQFANHLLDKTENQIETIKIHREHASEQHLRAQSFQSNLVTNIIDLYNLFQNSLNQMYNAKRKSLVDDFLSENLNRERILYEQKRYYENYAHATVSLMKSHLSNSKESFIEKRFDAEADFVIKTEALNNKKFNFESKICGEIEEIFKNFSKDWPKDRLDEYQTFFNQDNKIQDEIDALAKKLTKFEDEVHKLTKLWKAECAEMSRKIEVLNFEYKSMLNIHQSKKHERIEALSIYNQKLKALIIKATRIKKYLDERLEILLRVVVTHKICRKYEKLEDKMRFQDFGKDKNLTDENLNLGADTFSVLGQMHIFQSGNERNTCVKNKKCIQIIEESFLKNSNLNSSFTILNQRKDNVGMNSKEKPINFVSLFGEKAFNPNFQMIENIDLSPLSFELVNSSLKRPSLKTQRSINEIIIAEFFRKIAIVEADCVTLKRLKQKLIKDNKNLENLLTKREHEYGVYVNMKLLKLNSSPSIGKIGQISHQMPQIHEEILIRKCNAIHLKEINENNKEA